jgi:biopolymer transport protein ExbD
MAGGGDEGDNPIAINVVPLVDIIFCLCIFFLCSFRFEHSEGTFKTWLPKAKGQVGAIPMNPLLLEEVRVAIDWDDATARSSVRVGHRKVESVTELEEWIEQVRSIHALAGTPESPVTIDADPRVPMSELTAVVNPCRKHSSQEIEFVTRIGPRRM